MGICHFSNLLHNKILDEGLKLITWIYLFDACQLVGFTEGDNN